MKMSVSVKFNSNEVVLLKSIIGKIGGKSEKIKNGISVIEKKDDNIMSTCRTITVKDGELETTSTYDVNEKVLEIFDKHVEEFKNLVIAAKSLFKLYSSLVNGFVKDLMEIKKSK